MIGKRYQAEHILGKGSFSTVYQGKNIETNMPVAIKESQQRLKQFYRVECEVLGQTCGKKGFPKLYWHGESNQMCYIVMSLLGPSISSTLSTEIYTPANVCDLGQQVIKILETLHESCFLHRDIKPENIATSRKNPHRYYLIDFGLAKRFIDKSNCHIPLKNDLSFKGNLIFCSSNALSGIESSRRDDLISACLVLLFLIRRGLPWMRQTQSLEAMIGSRSSFSSQDLIKGVPYEISECYNYALSLNFYQKPNYSYMIQLLNKCKNFYLLDRTELFDNNSKKIKRKIKRNSVFRSKTEVNGVEDLLSTCSTVKIKAPDFSKDLRKKINLWKISKQETEVLEGYCI